MLLELRLKDFVLIPEARLPFEPGFIVLTGETGAGKSLLLQSLKLLLGARGGGHLIRAGAKEAVIEAVFDAAPLRERLSSLGFSPAEEVVVRRVITPERSRIYLNGSPVTAQMLANLTRGLIVLVGQHEYHLLDRAEERLAFLDAFCQLEDLLSRYQEAFRRLRELEEAHREFSARLRQLVKERDYLAFQIREIEEVDPRPGEDEELEAEAKRLKNLERLKELSRNVANDLSQAVGALSQARKDLLRAQELDPAFESLRERLDGLYYELEDLAGEVSSYGSRLHEDEGRLEEVENRLHQLRRLKRKYGEDLTQVVQELKRLKRELEDLESGEERLAEIEAELEKARAQVFELGRKLTERRLSGAKELSETVSRLLPSLALAGARFQVEVKRGEEPRERGFDRVEFLVATNPQSPLRPLSQVASGGELSRFFLALKVAAREKDTALLLFDEVDAGIGGETAHQVGRLLKELSSRQQVICVTHLPQIAALADQHFVVEKVKEPARAETRVRRLTTREERLRELARMLGKPEALELASTLFAG